MNPNQVAMLVQIYHAVFSVMALTAVIAVVGPRMPQWAWKLMVIIPGIILGVGGCYLAIQLVNVGGLKGVGALEILGGALGLTWSAVWTMYFLDHRKDA
jgi:hypothetical protein